MVWLSTFTSRTEARNSPRSRSDFSAPPATAVFTPFPSTVLFQSWPIFAKPTRAAWTSALVRSAAFMPPLEILLIRSIALAAIGSTMPMPSLSVPSTARSREAPSIIAAAAKAIDLASWPSVAPMAPCFSIQRPMIFEYISSKLSELASA